MEGLEEKERGKCLKWIELLEEHGPQLKRPYADFVEDGIYELRPRYRNLRSRFLYFFHNKQIIITHGFLKKTDEVPVEEKNKAFNLRTEWLKRND